MSNVRILKGDLLKAFDEKAVSVIAHSCNCFHKFGAGLALAIRKRYPRAYEADKLTKYADRYKLGQFSLSQQDNGGFVLNIYGQYGYGYKAVQTDYLALTHAMENVRDWMVKMKLETLGLPYGIGCGLGGADWNKVMGAIRYVFDVSSINVSIFQFEQINTKPISS